MVGKQFRVLVISSLLLFFIGAGTSKMYAGSVLLSKLISVNIQKQTTEKALLIIEKKAGVHFMYNPQMFNTQKTVTLKLQNATLKEILQCLINNKDMVFYEMGKYIVITNKHQAPMQAIVIPAFPSIVKPTETETVAHRVILDTIHTYDTIKITKTKHVVIYDTLKVYDTITKIIPKEAPVLVVVTPSTKIKNEWFGEVSISPQYSDIIPEAKNLGDLSLSANVNFGCKHNNIECKIGVGGYWQRGISESEKSTKVVDYELRKDTIQMWQKYKIGDYYDLQGNHIVKYDSTYISVPRQWYNITERNSTVITHVGYSIKWVIIPCHFKYIWQVSKRTSAGVGLGLTSAFVTSKTGFIYDSNSNKCVDISTKKFKSFALFASFEPSISYSLSKTFSIEFGPFIQTSIRSIMNEQSYVISGGCYVGLRKYL